MPYCPQCRDEFEDWVTICPDCRVPLVAELPPEPEEYFRKGPMVRIATVRGEIEAQIRKGILRDNGVESLVKVAESLNIYLSPLVLKHEIYVLEEDEEQAREILGDIVEPE